MNTPSFTIFYVTHASKRDARLFIDQCIKEQWIACGNIFPMQSLYLWQTEVVDEHEFVSIVKTGNHLVDSFIPFAESIHPYETPCLLHWEVKANRSYTEWIYDCVKK